MKLVFLICVGLFGVVLCAASKCGKLYSNKVTPRDAQIIVNKHNDLRKLIANGKVSGQPRGINLKRMKYDAKLAAEAQKIANTCEFAHKAVHDDRWGVGQNLYIAKFSYDNKTTDWQGAIQSWFSEYKSYKFGPCCNGFHATGHYTQVVWANTEYVGCGFTYFGGTDNWKYNKLYVCNYGPAGNVVGQRPYETGSSGCENLC